MPARIADLLRIIHFASAVLLGVLLYPDWLDDDGPKALARYVAFPLLTITGAALTAGRMRAMKGQPGA
jgi:hypothetical protein